VVVLGDDLAGLRDRAILTMGWMGAFRRSELVGLTVGTWTPRERGSWSACVARRATQPRGQGSEEGDPFRRAARVSAPCAQYRTRTRS